jgi:hypothetical protein
MIRHTYTENKTVINDERRCIASFKLSELEKYYRFHQLEKYLIICFVEKFHWENDIKNILVGWWVEDNIFLAKNDGAYTMTNLRDSYMYAKDLMCRLYGESKHSFQICMGTSCTYCYYNWLKFQLGNHAILCF